MRRTATVCGLSCLGLALVLLLLGAPVAHANATVGNGTPQSCTEQQFDLALAGGGLINFNCGPAPYTLTVHEKVISISTAVDGGGLITLSGNNLNRVFSVTTSGALYLNNLHVTRGFAGPLEHGAAIYSTGGLYVRRSRVDFSNCSGLCAAAILSSGPLLLENSSVSDNQMAVGGAVTIYGAGAAQIISSTISNNRSSSGNSVGGTGLADISSAVALLRDSSVISNISRSDGGGIYVGSASTLDVVNSTVSGNSAYRNGGGFQNEGALWLYNATVTNNDADKNLDGNGTGGGVDNVSGGVFHFRNTILAGNNDSMFSISFGWIPHYGDCAGALTSHGYNLIQNYNTLSCTIAGTFTLTIPLLGPLQFNGGTTLTHLPLPGSAAINAGDPAVCFDETAAPLIRDQRGFLRSAPCYIGAVDRTFHVFLPLNKAPGATARPAPAGR